MMPYLHESTFGYLKPTDMQLAQMTTLRQAAAAYAVVVDEALPYGPDKLEILRLIRTAAMWANVAVTRQEDGTPRGDDD